jgi:hypothetical protein
MEIPLKIDYLYVFNETKSYEYYLEKVISI